MTATETKRFCLYSEPFCWSEVYRRQIAPPTFCVSPVVPSAQIAHFSSFFLKGEKVMSKFCIMRFQKYKVGSVANIERHQKHRDRLKHRKHPEREGENRTWVQSPEKTMTQVVRHTIREQQEQTGRKVRKDAVVLVEFVLTFSPEMESSINFDDWNNANIEWLEKQFGKGKIIRYDLNADEQTRHGHYFLLPTDEYGNLNASKYFGKKQQVIGLQDSYAEAMEQFGLVRGISKEQTRANHTSLDDWYKQEEAQLLADIAKIEQEKAVIAQIAETVLGGDQQPHTQQRGVLGDDMLNSLE